MYSNGKKRGALLILATLILVLCAASWARPVGASSSTNRDRGAVVDSDLPPPATPTPSRHTSIFAFESDPGEFLGGGRSLMFTDADGAFTALHEHPGFVFIEFQRSTPFEIWGMFFESPRGSELVPGIYDPATNGGSSRKPGMNAWGAGRGCGFVKGWFEVREAQYTARGEVERFAVDFELRCENADPLFFGYVRIHSDVPAPQPRTPTPTPRPDSFVLTYEINPPGRHPTIITAAKRSVKASYYLSPWATLQPHVAFQAKDLEARIGVPNSWDLILASPVCADLIPDTYDGALEDPFEPPTAPGISFLRNLYPFCDFRGSIGRFVIHEAQYGEDGEVYRFAGDFEETCTGTTPPITVSGSISFVSKRPIPTPAPPTPTPTDYSTLATLHSELGDYVGHCTSQYLTLADGDFSASHDHGSVTIFFEGGLNWWSFFFAAPGGGELVPGRYVIPFGPSKPYMNISGQSRAGGGFGEFTVLEAEYGENHEVRRFAADFEQHVYPVGGALDGTVRFHSSLPPPTRLPASTPTPLPGHGPCWGDCSGDGVVTINELIRGVTLLLNQDPPDACRRIDRSNDGTVTIDELVAAVAASVIGCDSAIAR